MGLESATYITQFVPTNPDGADGKDQGDNHLRMIKQVLQNCFPSISGAVTVTHTDLNTVTLKANIASPAFTGTPTAPTGDGLTALQIVNFTALMTAIAATGTLVDLVDTPISTSGTSAVGTREWVDTTSGAITRTLPASPTQYQKIGFKDAQATWETNPLTIQPAAGQKIENRAVLETMLVTDQFAYFVLVWDGVDTWRTL